ncbi:hypothetical protein BDQ12DRAFT_634780 [Crucibulum laeve]|uniref:Uncharacterized protein n=1 Tax=Crucibulum laeve TaxID=68775 RepID=A0A5C3LRT0_9AGAR|nr:hypothetical protein BDQ12DRAFT_634780 [Crucibulum laeve]
MDKATSVIAAFEAGKLPSTQQFNAFIDWLNAVGITQVEPSAEGALSSQGKILANDFRGVLEAYKQLANNKNADNIVQKAIYHLTEGDLTVTSEAKANADQATKDINALRTSLRTLLSIVWSSVSSESSSLAQDFLSIIRLSIADAAEMVEEQASWAKDALRDVEKGVQEGDRDALGRDKKRLEEEEDTKVAWQHGMDTVKDAGTSVIGASQSASETVKEKSEETSTRLQDAYYKICDRAQSDPSYGQALDTIFSTLQKRLSQTASVVSDPSITLSTFIADPTPEQHIPKAISLIRTLLERLAGTSLEPLITKLRSSIASVLQDPDLKAWFNDFFESAKKNLSEAGYARSKEAQKQRKELRVRWRTLLEKDEKWKKSVEDVKAEWARVENGLKNDKDLQKVREAHQELGDDVESGLIKAGSETAKTGLQAAMDQATWFWQDLFKVYVPSVLSKLRDVPIPRTEYKDPEIEFVLENLDISSFNLLPSHVYIRNITDIDIKTADPSIPSDQSTTALGALTHIRVQALQLTLDDVSFWYKDKTATVGPAEFTGLMGLTLPKKGVDVDLKLRLIPSTTTGAKSRHALKHFNVLEHVSVSISEDVALDVKDSNHTVLVTLFKPIMVMRLREALEKTLTEQLRALIEWADGVAYDVGRRREVFEDTGVRGGAGLVAAIWSEIGRLQRESREEGTEVGWRATGTGLVVEQNLGEEGKAQLAMGAEPQILSGEKRGPMGTGSVPLRDRLVRAGEEVGVDVSAVTDMDVDVQGGVDAAKGVASEIAQRTQGAFKEGQKQVQSFKKSVDGKAKLEKSRDGWESAAFDFA